MMFLHDFLEFSSASSNCVRKNFSKKIFFKFPSRYRSGSNLCKLFTNISKIFFYLASVIGAVVSSTILEQTTVNGSDVTPGEDVLQFCGANDCPSNNVTNPNLEEPDPTLVRLRKMRYSGIAAKGQVHSEYMTKS